LSRAQRMLAPVLLAIDSLAATPRIRRAWIITRRKCTLRVGKREFPGQPSARHEL